MTKLFNAIYVYGRLVSNSIRAQMQYRASFIMRTVAHLLVTFAEFLVIWALFARFGNLRGWRLAEVAMMYGVVNVAFSICDALSSGFDGAHHLIRRGEFDRLLLRPRTTTLQLLGYELSLRRFARFAQGAAVLAWGAWTLGISWSPANLALLVATIAGGACLFLGLFILQATVSIWTVQSLEVMNVTTYGGVETAQFPISIYHPWFRRVFIYVLPLACISYFPVVTLIGRPDPLGAPVWVGWLSPIAGVVFLAVALRFWQFGVRHYQSTGS